ncbi:MAG: hypothetical protein VX438_07450, partial [Planctomycetota bacterium]|nr:hypothetical protein [Planctomycetota bacterium]
MTNGMTAFTTRRLGQIACLGVWLLANTPGASHTRLQDEDKTLALLVKTVKSSDNPAVRRALLKGMLNGLEGRRDVPTPNGWDELNRELVKSANKEVRELAAQLSQLFGDPQAIQAALMTLKNSKADPRERRAALVSLLALKRAEASLYLEVLLDEPELCLDAIRGYAVIENPTAAPVLLGRYAKMTPDQRKAVVETLATRKVYATELLNAVKQKKISREDIPAHVSRSLNALLGDRFVAVFGELKPVEKDR